MCAREAKTEHNLTHYYSPESHNSKQTDEPNILIVRSNTREDTLHVHDPEAEQRQPTSMTQQKTCPYRYLHVLWSAVGVLTYICYPRVRVWLHVGIRFPSKRAGRGHGSQAVLALGSQSTQGSTHTGQLEPPQPTFLVPQHSLTVFASSHQRAVITGRAKARC